MRLVLGFQKATSSPQVRTSTGVSIDGRTDREFDLHGGVKVQSFPIDSPFSGCMVQEEKQFQDISLLACIFPAALLLVEGGQYVCDDDSMYRNCVASNRNDQPAAQTMH